MPVRMLISVDLPAPLGPMIETNSPASTQAHAVEGAELSVELPEPVSLENHARDGGTGRRRVTSPMSPCGAKMTMIASIAPKISRQYGTIDITQFCR